MDSTAGSQDGRPSEVERVMRKMWLKVGSAAFAVAVLGALMVHAGSTAGCGGSRGAEAEPAAADVQPGAPPSSAFPPSKGEEDPEAHFPATKAGPIFRPKPSPAQQAPNAAQKK